MKTFAFDLVTDRHGLVTDDDIFDVSDAVFEAGCTDSNVHTYNGVLYLSFNREAESYEQAVISAIKQVETIGVTVLSVDAGDWVTLADAAELTGVTKAALTRYAKGTRGKGDFPSPLHRIDSRSPLWSWADIANWLKQNDLAESEVYDIAKTTAMINMSLQLRDKYSMDRVTTYMAAIDADNGVGKLAAR